MTTSEPIGPLTINLEALVLDPNTQIRAETCTTTTREYRENMRLGAVFPPITVAQVDPEDRERGFVLIDGWHRVTATKALGRPTIDALVLPGVTPKEYRWQAAQANRRHGLRLSRGDRREVFKAYVQAGKHRVGRGTRIKSAREMAKDLEGIVSDRRIPVWMRQDFPKVYRAMQGGGLEENPGSDFGRTDMDITNLQLAADALTQFKASFRAIRSLELKEALIMEITKAAQDVVEVASGKRALPAVQADEF